MIFTILIEKSPNNYGAWSPDLPGCVATGATVEETIGNMRGAIELHLKGMKEDGEPIPETSPTIMTTLQFAA
jgi:predicted RNase H-like HicB family nuclease